MKLRVIPDPVVGPFRRTKPQPDLKPLAAAKPPKPPAQIEAPAKPVVPSTLKPETKTAAPALETPNSKVKANKTINITPEVVLSPSENIIGKAADGTPIPAPYQPVDPIVALASENPGLSLLMLRQLRDLQGPMPDTSSGAVATMQRLQQGMRQGQDISAMNPEISGHIMGDDDYSELLNRLSLSVDRERLIEIMASRAKFEDFCHACLRRSEVNIVDGMSAMAYFNNQLTGIFARMDKKMARGESSMAREAVDLVDKINRPALQQNKELQRKFDGATPTEREIVRKIGFKAKTILASRVTKTTTETVEIVHQNDIQSP